MIRRFNLPKLYFQRLIEARERSSNEMFATAEKLEQHVEYSSSSIYYLLLRICQVDDINADHAASHLGKAQGISNMLRTLIALNTKENRGLAAIPPIPQDILLKYNCSYERILRQQLNDPDVQNCLFDVASISSIHLTKARQLNDKLIPKARNILLPAVSVDRFLKRLQFSNFQLTDHRLAKRDGLLALYYFWYNIRRRY